MLLQDSMSKLVAWVRCSQSVRRLLDQESTQKSPHLETILIVLKDSSLFLMHLDGVSYQVFLS
jgi:hypothetical protein